MIAIVRFPGPIAGSLRAFLVALSTVLPAAPGVAQEAPRKVTVGAATYLVSGDTVSGIIGSEPLDAVTIDKARFTARVMSRQILESAFNGRIFSASYRADIIAGDASGRLIEPWRKSLRTASAEDLVKAREGFKTWVSALSNDPRALLLAAVRHDYAAGLAAYQANAAIYRSVAKDGQPLSHESAVRFMRNAWPTIELAYARGLEEQLAANGAAAAVPGDDEFRRRLKAEVTDRVDNEVRNAGDLERMSAIVQRLADAHAATVRNYREGIRPAAVRFVAFDPLIGTAMKPQPTGQNPLAIAPAVSRRPALLDITGGILPSPYPIHRAAAGAGNAPAGAKATPAAATASGVTGANPAGTPANGQIGAPAADAAQGADNPAGTAAKAGGTSTSAADSQGAIYNADNLKTYSSKGYHRSDGWVFNPASGLWQDPNDPGQATSPTVITCCDETGLAFPSDAVEAQDDYVWNPGGVDPNCGRLYNCDPVADAAAATPTGDPKKPAGPTDKDDEILQAFDFIRKNVPPNEQSRSAANFMNSLPRAYYDRAVHLYVELRNRRSGGQMVSTAPMQQQLRAAGTSAPYSFSGTGRGSQSDITGVNGSSGGMNSRYTPVTQSVATNITSKYPILTSCQ